MTRRKRSRNRGIKLHGDVTVEPPPTGSGRKPAEDPLATAIAARMRHMPDTATRAEILDPMQGCEVGRKIAARLHDADTRATIWNAAQHMRRTAAAHDRAIGAPPRHAKVARILTPTDRMETSADAPAYDDRDEAEKVRAAITAMMVLQSWLDPMLPADRAHCIDAVICDLPIYDWSAVLAGLMLVAVGLEGKRTTA